MADLAPIHVLGTGSFALEVSEYARAAGRRVDGLIEGRDPSRVGTTVHGLPVIDGATSRGVAAIGMHGDRVALWQNLAALGWKAATIVHPAAHISPSAEFGDGCLVGPAAVVGAATRIGALAVVGRGALVGHHCEIEQGAVLNPGANVGGNTRIGAGAQVGMGATIVNGGAVGAAAVIGAGAVVLRDVPAGMRVQGVPATPYEDQP